MSFVILFVTLFQIWNPMADYWTEWQAIKSGYCGQEACYVDVKTDLWGKRTARIHVVKWVHEHTWPGRFCRFGGKVYNRYTRAQCKFPWVDTADYQYRVWR